MNRLRPGLAIATPVMSLLTIWLWICCPLAFSAPDTHSGCIRWVASALCTRHDDRPHRACCGRNVRTYCSRV